MDNRPFRLSVPTPLSNAYFSGFNRGVIQQLIRADIKIKTGYGLQSQSDPDIQSLMRVVYTDLVQDPNTNIPSQVFSMNAEVVRRATQTISSGMLQQLIYLRDISQNAVPLATPVSTSTYGNKIPINTKIGFGN